MKQINRENYGMFIIDYREGRLSAGREEELLSFLDRNPDLKEEFEEDEMIFLPAKETAFGKQSLFIEKDKLKHDIMPVNGIDGNSYEQATIAALEGDLPAALQDDLQKGQPVLTMDDPQRGQQLITQDDLEEFYRLNPSLQKVRLAFNNTKITPDLSIRYPDRERLKKSAVIPLYRKWIYSASAAAAVVLMIIVFSRLTENRPGDDMSLRYSLVIPVRIPKVGCQELTYERPYHNLVMESRNLSVNGTLLSPEGSFNEDLPSRNGRVERLTYHRMPALAMTSGIETETGLYAHLVYSRALPAVALAHDPGEGSLPAADPSALKKDKTVAAKIFSGLFKNLRNRVSISTPEEPGQYRGFWNATIKGYNNLTDRELELQAVTGDEGEVIGYTLTEQDQVILSRYSGQ